MSIVSAIRSLFRDPASVAVGIDFLQDRKLSGVGSTVAVFDSGVAPVRDLQTSLVGSYAYVDGKVIETDHLDFLGHGTTVAGVIAGSGASSHGKHKGGA